MDIAQLLDALPKSAVRPTADPSVFRMTHRLSLLRNDEADERAPFVRALQSELPFVLLWLDKTLKVKVQRAGSYLAATNGIAEFWAFNAASAVDTILPELFEGSWGMFFFLIKPNEMPPPPVPLVSGKPSSKMLLGSTGAQAGIFAEPDDIEWTIAFSSNGQADLK